MKTKLLLFMLLSLLAVRGSASPVDSLVVHSRGDFIESKWDVLNIKDTLLLADRLHYRTIPNSYFSDPSAEDWLTLWEFFRIIVKPWLGFLSDWQHADMEKFYGVTVGHKCHHTVYLHGFMSNGARLRAYLEYPDGTSEDEMCFSFFESGKCSYRDYNFYTGEYFDATFFDEWLDLYYLPTSAGTHRATVHFYYDYSNGLFSISKESSFEIIGTAVDRSVSTTDYSNQKPVTTLSFPEVTVGTCKYETIKVTAQNLVDELVLEINDQTGMFFFDLPSSIWPFDFKPKATRFPISAEDAAEGVFVHVRYEPTATGSHDASITISGGGALEKTLNLMGTAVIPPSPTITINPTPLNFGNVVKEKSATKSFIVKGTGLTGSLSLVSENSFYTISPTTITRTEATTGKMVSVTFKPTATGTYNGSITISGGGVDNTKVSLSGKCVESQSITISPSTWDFGTVNPGESKPMTFTVTGNNLNDCITVVSQFETTGNDFTVYPESLPESGGNVTVTYKPISEGSSSKDIIFTSGEVSTTLTVSGNDVPPRIDPDVLSLDFGTVVKGKNARKTFKVNGVNLTGDLTLSSNRPYFTVSPYTITAAEAKDGKTVMVTYTPTAGGNHNATLTISGGGAEDKLVSLTGKCAAIDITPSSSHNFGTVKAGTANTKDFTVKGTNLSSPITINWQLESPSGVYSISPTSLPATGGTVKVTFKPTSAGSYSQDFILKSGQASGTISVSGKCATITTSRSSLNFGTIAKGKEKSDTLKVKGAYLTGDLTLSSSSSMFKVVPDKITASEAAAGKTVTVTYKPTVKGIHTATITISGGNAAPKLVQLTGKCVVPVITTSTNSINYMGKESKQFKVTGTDLTGNLTLTIIGSGKNYFNLSKTSITASAAASGVIVSVLCNAPSTLSSASAQVKISGGDAVTKYVDLYYNQNQPQAINSVQPGTQDENGNDNSNNEFTNGVMLEMTGPLTTDVNELLMNARVYAEGLNIIIETPMEQKALISDIAGHVREVNLKAGRNEIPVNANGVFIVRIREKTTKLMLK